MENELLLSKNHQNAPKAQRILGSCRCTLALISFFGLANIYACRINLSLAIVAMVKVNSTRDQNNLDGHRTDYKRLNTTSETSTGEFDWSPSIQGLILSSFYYGYVVTQIPAGFLIQRYGTKWIIGLAVLISSLLTLLSPIAAKQSYMWLVVIRIVEGLCQGMIYPALNATWALWAPKWERTRLIAFTMSGNTIGTVLALSLSGLLSSSSFLGGWPSIFYVFGTLGCIWFVPWCYLVYDSPKKHPRISKEERVYIQYSAGISSLARRTPWLKIATSKPVWALGVIYMCVHWGYITMLTNLPTYLSRILHFDLEQNGILSAVPYMGMFVTTNLSSVVADYVRSHGYLSTRTTRKIYIVIGLGVPAVLMVSVGYVGDNTYLALALVLLSVVFCGITNASYQINIVDIAPLYAGTLMGICNTLGAVPGLVAPLIVGLLTDHNETKAQWQDVFIIAAAINVFGALVYSIFGDGEEQCWAKGHESDTSGT